MSKDTEQADAQKVAEAIGFIREGKIAKAQELLQDVCSRCPDTYQYEFVEGDTRYVKFWDMEEFLSFVGRLGKDKKEEVVWLVSAYPRACYWLGFLFIERRDFASALGWLKKGQRLEPYNAKFLNEMGFIYSELKDPVNALASFEAALGLPSISNRDLAIALRGAAINLVDLGRLEEAKEKLLRSLEIDPDSDLAKSELAYIADLQAEHEGTAIGNA